MMSLTGPESFRAVFQASSLGRRASCVPIGTWSASVPISGHRNLGESPAGYNCAAYNVFARVSNLAFFLGQRLEQ